MVVWQVAQITHYGDGNVADKVGTYIAQRGDIVDGPLLVAANDGGHPAAGSSATSDA